MALNPDAINYLDNSNKYWQQALEQLNAGEIAKASELAWGSVVEKIKALALMKGEFQLGSHYDIRNYIKEVSHQIQDKELYQLFRQAEGLHVEFYECHLDSDDVREAILNIEKLLIKLELILHK